MESLSARPKRLYSPRSTCAFHIAITTKRTPPTTRMQSRYRPLLSSLSERGGVPAHRLSYWNDIEYNPGRVKASRKVLFERNDCLGVDIYTHPHFIKHLRHLLLGADLADPGGGTRNRHRSAIPYR